MCHSRPKTPMYCQGQKRLLCEKGGKLRSRMRLIAEFSDHSLASKKTCRELLLSAPGHVWGEKQRADNESVENSSLAIGRGRQRKVIEWNG